MLERSVLSAWEQWTAYGSQPGGGGMILPSLMPIRQRLTR